MSDTINEVDYMAKTLIDTGWKAGLKKAGKYYLYRIMINGRLHTGSTSQERLKDAQKELERIRQKANHQAKGSIYIPLLSEVLIEWKNTQKSKNHAEKHIENCNRLFETHVIPITGDIKFDKISAEHIENITTSYLNSHSEHGTNTLITYIKCILRYGQKKYKVDVPEVDKIKTQAKEIVFLSFEEIDTFLNEIDFIGRKGISVNPQISLASRIMLDHGWREDEIINMKEDNINKKSRKYILDKTKGKESPIIQLSSEVMEWIEKVQADKRKRGITSEYVLCQTRGKHLGEKHKEGFTSNPIRRASKRMGMNFGPHTLRKTHACLLAENGESAFVIQASLRHKSIQPSMAYVKVVDRRVAEAHTRMKARQTQIRKKAQEELEKEKVS